MHWGKRNPRFFRWSDSDILIQQLVFWCLALFTKCGIRGSSSLELNHLIPPAFSRLEAGCACERDPLDGLKCPIDDHPLDARREPSTLERWICEILCCDPKGRRALDATRNTPKINHDFSNVSVHPNLDFSRLGEKFRIFRGDS